MDENKTKTYTIQGWKAGLLFAYLLTCVLAMPILVYKVFFH